MRFVVLLLLLVTSLSFSRTPCRISIIRHSPFEVDTQKFDKATLRYIEENNIRMVEELNLGDTIRYYFNTSFNLDSIVYAAYFKDENNIFRRNLLTKTSFIYDNADQLIYYSDNYFYEDQESGYETYIEYVNNTPN